MEHCIYFPLLEIYLWGMFTQISSIFRYMYVDKIKQLIKHRGSDLNTVYVASGMLDSPDKKANHPGLK